MQSVSVHVFETNDGHSIYKVKKLDANDGLKVIRNYNSIIIVCQGIVKCPHKALNMK